MKKTILILLATMLLSGCAEPIEVSNDTLTGQEQYNQTRELQLEINKKVIEQCKLAGSKVKWSWTGYAVCR
jgi:PBP1b-binding outer membrane lipoprotein LpoB